MALPKFVEDNTMKMVAMTVTKADEKAVIEQAFDEYRSMFGATVKDWPDRLRAILKEADATEELLAIYDAYIKRYVKRQIS